jgi:hypothetical protein
MHPAARQTEAYASDKQIVQTYKGLTQRITAIVKATIV